MTVHADLPRHVREVFLPSLKEPHRETAQILFEQIQKLEDLRTQSTTWFTEGQSAARDACQLELAAIATEVCEAYKQVIRVAQQP